MLIPDKKTFSYTLSEQFSTEIQDDSTNLQSASGNLPYKCSCLFWISLCNFNGVRKKSIGTLSLMYIRHNLYHCQVQHSLLSVLMCVLRDKWWQWTRSSLNIRCHLCQDVPLVNLLLLLLRSSFRRQQKQ